MTERLKSWLVSYAVPLLIGAMALGAAKLELRQKEAASDHVLDIQRVEAQQASDKQASIARDEAIYALQLDVLCAVKPHDRRCYPSGK